MYCYRSIPDAPGAKSIVQLDYAFEHVVRAELPAAISRRGLAATNRTTAPTAHPSIANPGTQLGTCTSTPGTAQAQSLPAKAMAEVKAFAGGAGDPSLAPMQAGAFKRGASNFQNWITPGTAFPPEPDRYHLYINYTCGWCHRALIIHALKNIPQSVVSISSTANYFWGGGLGSDDYSGWAFDAENPDPVLNAQHTRDIYLTDSPDYGRRQLSVPILFDKKTRKIVCNDNIQIGYILNSCLDDLLDEDGKASKSPVPMPKANMSLSRVSEFLTKA